jgi:hypothetical protein
VKRNVFKAITHFVVGIAELTFSFFRVVGGFHFRSSRLARQRGKALVLGNGPSLKDDLAAVGLAVASGTVDLWCVNFFASTEAYTSLKPANYVIADPAHWEDDITEQLKQEREQFLERVTRVTDWKVLFHLPYQAKGTGFVDRLLSNKHITIRFFNRTAVVCRSKALLFWLYRRELAMPACQNVLIGALFLTILCGYDKVGIVGADHSWHKNILVRDGVVMVRDHHFYGSDATLEPFYKNATETFSMAEIFHIWSKVFTQYDLLSAFARAMQVSVVNSSSVSYIDSFKSLELSRF